MLPRLPAEPTAVVDGVAFHECTFRVVRETDGHLWFAAPEDPPGVKPVCACKFWYDAGGRHRRLAWSADGDMGPGVRCYMIDESTYEWARVEYARLNGWAKNTPS